VVKNFDDGTLLPSQFGRYFGTSLEECQRFTKLFYNTCDTYLPASQMPPNVASIPVKSITCKNTGSCVDSGSFNAATGECTWQAKVCAYCELTASQTVRITVMSNGLPQKCFYSPDRQLKEQNIHMSV